MASVMGLELHQPTMIIIWGQGDQSKRKKKERNIPYIQKFSFHLPRVRIFGTNHCSDLRRTSFKHCELFQDVLCCCNYDERAVASFTHQIQSEIYGEILSVSIECITLEKCSAFTKGRYQFNYIIA